MNEHKRNRLDLATKLSNARKDAKEAAARRKRPVFLSLHSSTSWRGADAIEITGAAIPRKLVEQGLSVRNGSLVATEPITFQPSQLPVPAVITHVAVWDGIEGGELLLIPSRLAEPIVLRPGEALHFPRLVMEAC